MAKETIDFNICVPITAPFEDLEPGDVKLHDGDLTYVKLRPGTFSRQESISYGGHTQSLRSDLLMIKNARAVGTDVVVTLANLRSSTASVRKAASWLENMMGPAYGIIILKDILNRSNLPQHGDSFDHCSEKVVFIPVPQSFSKIVVLEDHIVISNRDYFAAYNRHDGILGFTNYEKPPESPTKMSKMFHPPIYTSDGFLMGTSFFKAAAERKWFDSPGGQLVETDWNIKRYKVGNDGDIAPVSTVLAMSCHQASEKLKDELAFVWLDELVYPSICRTKEPATILLKSYHDSVTDEEGNVRIYQEFHLPVELNLNRKTAVIEDVEVFPGCLSFHVSSDQSGDHKSLIIIGKDSKSVMRWFDITEMIGYDKHVVTSKKIFIGLAANAADFRASGNNKGLSYEIQATDFSEDDLKTVYKGEGLSFTVDFKMDDLLVIHKNFDEISLLEI